MGHIWPPGQTLPMPALDPAVTRQAVCKVSYTEEVDLRLQVGMVMKELNKILRSMDDDDDDDDGFGSQCSFCSTSV